MPIEESCLKPQVMISNKMRTRETGAGNGQREGSQSYVEAMKTGCQMKRGPERAIPTLQGGGEILHRLDGGKGEGGVGREGALLSADGWPTGMADRPMAPPYRGSLDQQEQGVGEGAWLGWDDGSGSSGGPPLPNPQRGREAPEGKGREEG